MRTWGVDGLDPLLDEAQTLGLTVTAGIWLGQQSGFDYRDVKALERQRDEVRRAVVAFRDAPALLMWGLGNEMEMGGADDSEALWREVEVLARIVREEDPRHPIMTVVADFNPAKIAAIRRFCPSIDVLGVNSYGNAITVPERLAAAAWDRPYVLAEFGARGWWESPKTPWGAPLEETSTRKAERYRATYRHAVSDQRSRCLGSYAFLWEHKWEGTHTWFGMHLPGTNERLAAVDAMSQCWTGRASPHRVPEIVSCDATLALRSVAAGSAHTARVLARDPDGDPIAVRWEVREEGRRDGAEEARRVGGVVSGERIAFSAPASPGAYRLFVYVSDGHGGAAAANVPFQVK